jgi:hypothetical protein
MRCFGQKLKATNALPVLVLCPSMTTQQSTALGPNIQTVFSNFDPHGLHGVRIESVRREDHRASWPISPPTLPQPSHFGLFTSLSG